MIADEPETVDEVIDLTDEAPAEVEEPAAEVTVDDAVETEAPVADAMAATEVEVEAEVVETVEAEAATAVEDEVVEAAAETVEDDVTDEIVAEVEEEEEIIDLTDSATESENSEGDRSELENLWAGVSAAPAAAAGNAVVDDPFLAALRGPERTEFDGEGEPDEDRNGFRRRRRTRRLV